MQWGELYAFLITVTGWTWEYIDEYMTLPRLAELSAYWHRHPPTHLITAWANEWKPPEPVIMTEEGEQALPEFASLPEFEE